MKKLNRIITPVLALGTLPILYFLPLLNIFVSSGLQSGTDEKTNLITKYLELRQYMSINFLVKFMQDDSHSKLWYTVVDAVKSENTGAVSSLLSSAKWVYAAIAFLVLTVVLAVTLAVFAAIGKYEKTNICLGAGSCVSAFAMNLCFNAFAKPFLNGSINVSSLLSSAVTTEDAATALNSITGLLSGLINKIANVDVMQLSSAYSIALFTLIIAVIFCIAAAVAKD